MKTSAKCTLADMILAYIGEVENGSDDLKENDMEEDDDIFKEPKGGKPKIVVKSTKAAPKKG
jgi:hypothetical protein